MTWGKNVKKNVKKKFKGSTLEREEINNLGKYIHITSRDDMFTVLWFYARIYSSIHINLIVLMWGGGWTPPTFFKNDFYSQK